MSAYVGIDVHRKRSQVAVIDASGEVLANRNVPNSGADPEGDRWLAAGNAGRVRGGVRHELAGGAAGGLRFAPHLVHPSRCKAIASARLKNDKVDAAILAQLLRADRGSA